MDGIAYFPGCSLKDTAKDFESSACAVMEALGLPLVELDRWNCCGTVYSLATDDLMHQLASMRDLVRAQEMGENEVVAACAMCYNTLKRVSLHVNDDAEARDKMNAFMNEETDYEGGVEVRHLLEILRDRIGWEKVSERVTRPLEGLTVAPYYGCTLVRPRAAGIDDPDAPTVMRDLIEALGATPVPFPFATECCGSYQVVDRRDLVIERSDRVVRSARRASAQVIVTSCPLCQHNLEQAQEELHGGEPIPVLYFTQLMAAAFGVEAGEIPAAIMGRLAAAGETGRGN